MAIDWSRLDPVSQAALERMFESTGALQLREIEDRYKLGKAQLQNTFKIAAMDSRDRRAALEATREDSRARIALAREELERLGIPRLELDRWTAEKNYEIAREELGFKREELGFRREELGESARQFDLSTAEGRRQFNESLAQRQAEFGAELGQRESEFGRTYGLNVAQLGAELGAQPDRYFQARRFQALDAPMLLGQQAGQPAQGYGGPTPQIATLGARLSGQDPAVTGARQPGQEPSMELLGQMDAGPDQVMGTADDRPKQIAQIAKASPPSPYDGMDEQDAATLRLIESVYKKGGRQAPRGSLERVVAAGREGVFKSGGTFLGYDPAEYAAEYNAYRPTQGQANLA